MSAIIRRVSTPDSLRIRPAEQRDAAGIRAIYGDVVTKTTLSFEEEVPSLDEIARRMSSRPRLPWFVAGSDGEVIGYAYSSPHRPRAAYRWSVECSIYVADGHRGHGVGRLLYERLIHEVLALGYVSLFAAIALPNGASVRLHEALGFRPIGVFPNVGFKHGTWHDVGWWVLSSRREPPVDPDEPRGWDPAA